jgi:hypothetical protein
VRSVACVLFVVLGSVGAWMAPALRTPRDVAREYCRLDGEGQQLTDDGWQTMAAFFVSPPRTRGEPSRFAVVKDCAVFPTRMQGPRQAAVIVEFLVFGTLDRASLGFTPVPPNGGPIPMRWDLTLRRTSAGWKIDDVMTTPQITVQTAIRYVTQTRDTTSDPAVKAEAGRTLATLRGLFLR